MNNINNMLQNLLNCFSDTKDIYTEFDNLLIEKRNPALYTTIGIKSMDFENDFYSSSMGRLVPIKVVFRISVFADKASSTEKMYSYFENVVTAKLWSSGLNIVKTTTKPIDINRTYNKLELYSEITVSGIAVM